MYIYFILLLLCPPVKYSKPGLNILKTSFNKAWFWRSVLEDSKMSLSSAYGINFQHCDKHWWNDIIRILTIRFCSDLALNTEEYDSWDPQSHIEEPFRSAKTVFLFLMRSIHNRKSNEILYRITISAIIVLQIFTKPY